MGASKMSPNTKGGKKQAAPTKLFRYLCRGVLCGSGGTQHMPVRLRTLNEYRTTVCCSKCGERTTAPYVTDYRTHRRRKSTRLRECPACKQRWEQGGEEGAAVGAGGWGGGSGSKGEQSGGGKEGGLAGDVEGEGVGEGRAQAGGGMVGDGDHAAVLAQSASVKKPQPAFQMHRDLNAAWNLWNVLAAEYAGLPRPAYLKQPPAAHCCDLTRWLFPRGFTSLYKCELLRYITYEVKFSSNIFFHP